MNTTDTPVIEAIYAERLHHAKRVMRGLTEEQRLHNFDLNVVAVNSTHGPVMCIAGHCGMDPWFREQGFSTGVDDDIGYTTQPISFFFGTSVPFHRCYYPDRVLLRGVTVDDAVSALDRKIEYFSRITLEKFVEWLRALPASTTFCEGLRWDTCPLAKFLGKPVDNLCFTQDWMLRFIGRYDLNLSRSLVYALRIAEDLLAEVNAPQPLNADHYDELH